VKFEATGTNLNFHIFTLALREKQRENIYEITFDITLFINNIKI